MHVEFRIRGTFSHNSSLPIFTLKLPGGMPLPTWEERSQAAHSCALVRVDVHSVKAEAVLATVPGRHSKAVETARPSRLTAKPGSHHYLENEFTAPSLPLRFVCCLPPVKFRHKPRAFGTISSNPKQATGSPVGTGTVLVCCPHCGCRPSSPFSFILRPELAAQTHPRL